MSRVTRLRRYFRRRSPPGTAPGTVTPDTTALQPTITVTCYGPDRVVEEQFHSAGQLGRLDKLAGRHAVTWIDVEGLGSAEVIHALGTRFGLHRLALEDVVNTHQRAKVEDYGAHFFVVARMVVPDERLSTEQLSLFLGKDFVLTFQERSPDQFVTLREAIRQGKGRLRELGADYLAYLVLDTVVDGYFPVLERCGEWLERIDEAVDRGRAEEVVDEIHDLRADLLLLRRVIWPLRDALGSLLREVNPLLSAETRFSLRDCHDHAIQILDLVETSRELCADLREYYQSAVNTRMNRIITVLTIVTSIFIPLSFVAGVYGMNFDPDVSPWNMPELRWTFGYPFALAVMGAMTALQLVLFWRSGWLGHRRRRKRGRPAT